MSSKDLKNQSYSVRIKLLNLSRKLNVDYNYLVLQYTQERFLFRLSKSKYVNNFILKGALLLYSSGSGIFRPTKDIDFSGYSISNEENNVRNIFAEISGIKHRDGLSFKPNISLRRIAEANEYKGLRVSLPFVLDTIKSVLTIDVAFGDVSYKKPEFLDYPVLLKMPHPRIKADSIETVIAEKFHAIVKLNFLTSRMKDFYDIIFIAGNYSPEKQTLKISIEKTFKNRNTSVENRSAIYTPEFRNDIKKQKQWEAFLKRIKSDSNDDFNSVIDKINLFIEPVFIPKGGNLQWDKNKWKWNKRV